MQVENINRFPLPRHLSSIFRYKDEIYFEKLTDFLEFGPNTNSWTTFVAPHAGIIEPGSGLVASRMARQSKGLGYQLLQYGASLDWDDLHIGSVQLGENKDRFPLMSRLSAMKPDFVVTIHGHGGKRGDENIIYLGGLAEGLLSDISEILSDEILSTGYLVKMGEEVPHSLRGLHAMNITNCFTPDSIGVQIELPYAVRNIPKLRDKFVVSFDKAWQQVTL